MSTVSECAPLLRPVAVAGRRLDLPAALYAMRWMVHDTFRQSLASGIFWLMLAVTAVTVAVCFSVGIEGGGPLVDDRGQRVEFLPGSDPNADPARASKAGVEVVRGKLTIAFGAIEMPLGRDAADAVRFLQAWLGVAVGQGIGFLLVLIWTAGFLPTFLDSSTASVMLAKPVPRWSLLLGKYLGVLLFVAVHALLFVGGTWLALGLRTGVWDGRYFLSIPILLLNFSIFFSFETLLAVATRSTVASVFGVLLFWGLCMGLNAGRHYALTLPGLEGMSGLIEVAYWLLPKPVDLGLVLLDGLGARNYFGPSPVIAQVEKAGQFHPGLSIVTSLLFAVGMLALAAYEFVTTDY